jgi:hypothetical protein
MAELQVLVTSITDETPGSVTWCIFDNTASGAALRNALALDNLIHEH